MTGEVKRYDIYSGIMCVDPTGPYMHHADHLAVVEGLRADAERYRWLRNHGLVASDPQTADELDAAIDEAMRGGDDLAR